MATSLSRLRDYAKLSQQTLRRSGVGSGRPSTRTGLGANTGGASELVVSKRADPQERWKAIKQLSPQGARAERILLDDQTRKQYDERVFDKNVEHFIGEVRVPLGLCGPLRVNGGHANGIYMVPLATTEAALVASFTRGARLITESGGADAWVVDEGVSRVPVFQFASIGETRTFVEWLQRQDTEDDLRREAESTTNHGKLLELKVTVEGTRVHVKFDFYSADASGQNMVTFAAERGLNYILKHSPVQPTHANLDGGFSSDKKGSIHSLQTVRGRKAVCGVRVPAKLVQQRLHATPHQMVVQRKRSQETHQLIGTTGSTFHAANGLAAMYIALGQDPACVAESHIGVCRFDVDEENGDLLASITLPNLMLATVGGGTKLPTQSACLDVIRDVRDLGANGLAEIAAAVCLGGEMSLCAALAAGEFSNAHKTLARGHDDKASVVPPSKL